MADPLTIRCREDGPYVIQGSVTVVDTTGKPFPIPAGKEVVALCRCGASKAKPFCDGAHKGVGFKAGEKAPE
jgi:CDGSH-type Zn-finger protein